MAQQIVTINGVEYDHQTGLPISPEQPKPERGTHHDAAAIHRHTQRSSTLNRRYVKRTASAADAHEKKPITVTTSTKPATTPAPKIQKFAKHPSAVTKKHTATQSVISDIGPTVHPMVQRVHAARAKKSAEAKRQSNAPKPSDLIKKEAIERSLQAAPSHTNRHRAKRHKEAKRTTRPSLMRLATAGAALFLVAGYFTYLNMPNLSVRVAAAQAGIDASYPSYRPSGYSLNGPVAYGDGEVSMKFTQNGTQNNFKLSQAKSGWDSSAVATNVVEPAVGDDYTTTQANGLTIYSYQNKAAWVNNGIFYSIDGDAELTSSQIQQLATSM